MNATAQTKRRTAVLDRIADEEIAAEQRALEVIADRAAARQAWVEAQQAVAAECLEEYDRYLDGARQFEAGLEGMIAGVGTMRSASKAKRPDGIGAPDLVFQSIARRGSDYLCARVVASGVNGANHTFGTLPLRFVGKAFGRTTFTTAEIRIIGDLRDRIDAKLREIQDDE